jgi:hypothetical protein
VSFSDLWETLESEAEVAGPGEVRRRIYPDSAADLWLVVYNPGRIRTLRVAVGDLDTGLEDLPSGSGIDTFVLPLPGGGSGLEVSLTNKAYEDLFDALIGDIAEAAAAAPEAADVPVLVVARVRRWQAFLRELLEGLSRERQRGLFGELWVLDSVLDAIGSEGGAVQGWVGPYGAPQDFGFGPTAIEVKTSAGKNPQRVRISSERQLDDAPVDRIFLWHLSVDERTGSGETLPVFVERLRDRLEGGAGSVGFEDALFAAGYHDAHAHRYQVGYTIRSSDVFEVSPGFPRLTEADCPDGLGDVHYSLELGALAAFKVARRSHGSTQD